MVTLDSMNDKGSSPLMRVGSTITSSISSPGTDFSAFANNMQGRRFDSLRNSVPVGNYKLLSFIFEHRT